MAATQALTRVVVNASAMHTATVIFVHGLGDSGSGWQPVAEQLKRDGGLKHVKWILPNACVLVPAGFMHKFSILVWLTMRWKTRAGRYS